MYSCVTPVISTLSIDAERYVSARFAPDRSMTDDTSGLWRLTASASMDVMRGFDCTLSHSSSLRTMPNCWTMKESAPA